MHSMNIIILIIIAACLLPYVFTFIAKFSAGYKEKIHGTPREFLQQTTGLAARANAVQQNSFEGLPLFIAAMLLSDYLVVRDEFVILLGAAYLFFRVIYGICYLYNLVPLRSIIWGLATLCPILLLILCMKPIY